MIVIIFMGIDSLLQTHLVYDKTGFWQGLKEAFMILNSELSSHFATLTENYLPLIPCLLANIESPFCTDSVLDIVELQCHLYNIPLLPSEVWSMDTYSQDSSHSACTLTLSVPTQRRVPWTRAVVKIMTNALRLS